MRVASALLAVSCCLFFGCAADGDESSAGPEMTAGVMSEEVAALEAPIAQAEAIGQSRALQTSQVGTQQACSSHCNCPIGYRCDSGACQPISLPGPPPPSSWCVADCQCPTRSYCDGTGGAAGLCYAPTCSVAWNLSTAPPGATVNFIVSSTDMPANGHLRLYGTRNGVTDVNGSVYPYIYGTFPITNSPGLSGVYMRYVRMYTASGRLLCQSNQATVLFQ